MRPCGCGPQKHSTEWRTICHHHPESDSLNDYIPKDPYSLQHVWVDDAIRIIKSLGPGSLKSAFDAFKISQVTPIYKSGDGTNTWNYRPISTLSPFTRILESSTYEQLYAFLGMYNILYKYQFDFRKGFSTE